MCQSVLKELRKEAKELIVKLISENPSFKGEVERQTKEDKEYIVKNVVNDVLWLVWRAGTGKPYEKIVYLSNPEIFYWMDDLSCEIADNIH